jgi:hypothetical protein
MTVALLILIVFILLFGAGVVKGWLANVMGYGLGGAILVVLLAYLGSFLGEYGVLWVLAIAAALLVLAVALEDVLLKRARQTKQKEQEQRKPYDWLDL